MSGQNKKAGAGGLLLKVVSVTMKTLAPVVILVGGGAAVVYMMETAPVPAKREVVHKARLVEVTEVERGPNRVLLDAQGTVMPAQEVVLSPQVTGAVVELNPSLVPGGRLAQGEVVLRIDPRDYELALSDRKSDVVRMESELTMAKASQDVARREYETLGEELATQEKSLVLREPQIAAAEANLAAARAMVSDAELSLERTTVEAPFDALVVEEMVDLGSRLSTQSTIARLVGTEKYWVEIALPQSDLRWVPLPEDGGEGALVHLSQPMAWGEGAEREGRVVRLLPDLSREGRMARLLVEVDDPLALMPENAGMAKLLVGQYLRAVIEGREVEDSLLLDRRLLHEGNKVWVMNAQDALEIRELDIAYRGLEQVLALGGVEHGERVVTSGIAAPAEGMPLRVAAPASGAPS
ncbi:MAG: efflux RND transporter periplasmic adaptor subunit [Candidatus Hydrogenedens sp.]|nr:efflux RND transporter periplasmic adaptor subunit [Candidatus Hydrogenedens sp.]